MNQRRLLWTCLFVGQLALVATASALATAGHLPTTVFRAPFDKLGILAFGLAARLLGRPRATAEQRR
jgi:hypothetical protein